MAHAIEHSPNDTYVHAELGWEQVDSQRYEVARDHFLESLRINPKNGQAHWGLAWVNFWSLGTGRQIYLCVKFILLVMLIVVLAAGFGEARGCEIWSRERAARRGDDHGAKSRWVGFRSGCRGLSELRPGGVPASISPGFGWLFAGHLEEQHPVAGG